MNTAGTLSIAGAQDLQGFKNLEGLQIVKTINLT
jgi:hypothetical protein